MPTKLTLAAAQALEYAWRHEPGEDVTCPNDATHGPCQVIQRYYAPLQTDCYRVCVKCRTRKRNSLNYHKRSAAKQRQAKISAKRTRVRNRIRQLEFKLASIEGELAQAKGEDARPDRRCATCGRWALS